MSLFRERKRKVPGLNTASLPDLVFTVLFFFMIVTHMRSTEVNVDYTMPQGTQLEELKKRDGVYYIYIGRPAGVAKGSPADTVCIRMDGQTVSPADIAAFIRTERSAMTVDELRQMTVNITIDRDVEMGIVNDVKRALRSSTPIHINYEAEERK